MNQLLMSVEGNYDVATNTLRTLTGINIGNLAVLTHTEIRLVEVQPDEANTASILIRGKRDGIKNVVSFILFGRQNACVGRTTKNCSHYFDILEGIIGECEFMTVGRL